MQDDVRVRTYGLRKERPTEEMPDGTHGGQYVIRSDSFEGKTKEE